MVSLALLVSIDLLAYIFKVKSMITIVKNFASMKHELLTDKNISSVVSLSPII